MRISRVFRKNEAGEYIPTQLEAGSTIVFNYGTCGIEITIDRHGPLFFSKDGKKFSETCHVSDMRWHFVEDLVDLFSIASGFKLVSREQERWRVSFLLAAQTH